MHPDGTRRSPLVELESDLADDAAASATSHSTAWTAPAIIVVVDLALFVLMVVRGVLFFQPTGDTMIPWGANYGPMTLSGESWRLVTSLCLHYGIVHLALNMAVLANVGRSWPRSPLRRLCRLSSLEKWKADGMTDDEFGRIVEQEVLPSWRAERQKLASTSGIPAEQQQLMSLLLDYMAARDESWTLLVDGMRTNDAEKITRSTSRPTFAGSGIVAGRWPASEAVRPDVTAKARFGSRPSISWSDFADAMKDSGYALPADPGHGSVIGFDRDG